MKRDNMIAGFWIVLLTALLLAVVAWGQTAPTASLDFTSGIPASVVAKQAEGALIHYPSYKCAHVHGVWYFPWVLEAGDRMEIDIVPRYPINEGIIVNGVKRAVGRSSASTLVISNATGQVGIYGTDTTTSNQIQWLRARWFQAEPPTPTPTPTPTATSTETPTPTPTLDPTPNPTIDYSNWWPVWRKIKDSQDVVIWERWLVSPGSTMVRIESATVFPATVDLRVGSVWVGEGVLQEQSE